MGSSDSLIVEHPPWFWKTVAVEIELTGVPVVTACGLVAKEGG